MKVTAYILDGRVINIGEWDLQEQNIIDEKGKEQIIILNPIPAGAERVENYEVAITADEKIVAATDYQALRACEYPPVTDYLDAVVKGDEDQLNAYIQACLAVKSKYPKPGV